MDRSESLEIVEMLRTLIHQLDIRPTWKSSHIDDVTPSSTAFVLSKAIEAIEWLDSALEDCERPCSLAISRNNELEQEREKSTQLEQRCSELVIDRDKAVEYWTKHCEGLLQKHSEELATKDREIYELKLERDKNSDSVTYWKCKCHKLEKAKANDPANFCGNCRHYAQMGKDDGDFEGICTQYYIKRVDPDDASCPHFKTTYDTRVVIGKPEFPCCDHCNHDDCDNCTLCPF